MYVKMSERKFILDWPVCKGHLILKGTDTNLASITYNPHPMCIIKFGYSEKATKFKKNRI